MLPMLPCACALDDALSRGHALLGASVFCCGLELCRLTSQSRELTVPLNPKLVRFAHGNLHRLRAKPVLRSYFLSSRRRRDAVVAASPSPSF